MRHIFAAAILGLAMGHPNPVPNWVETDNVTTDWKTC